MKKSIIVLVTVILITALSGCARNSLTTDKAKTSEPNKVYEQNKVAVSEKNNGDTNATKKITKDEAKKLDDGTLLKMSQESSTNLDKLDTTDEDLSNLDDILNGKDPIADIPKTIDLK